MKDYEVKCYFEAAFNSFDTLHSARYLRFKASDVFRALLLARDYLQSRAEDVEILGSLYKIEVVEV